MRKELLLCVIALFAVGSAKEGCDCDNVDGMMKMREKIDDLTAKYVTYIKEHQKLLGKLYYNETAYLRTTIGNILSVDYLREQLNVPNEVDLNFCLKNYQEQIVWTHNWKQDLKASCAQAYTKETILQSFAQTFLDLRKALEDLHAFCYRGLSVEPIECLGELEKRFENISLDLESTRERLATMKLKNIQGYTECMDYGAAAIELMDNNNERHTISCILGTQDIGPSEDSKIES